MDAIGALRKILRGELVFGSSDNYNEAKATADYVIKTIGLEQKISPSSLAFFQLAPSFIDNNVIEMTEENELIRVVKEVMKDIVGGSPSKDNPVKKYVMRAVQPTPKNNNKFYAHIVIAKKGLSLQSMPDGSYSSENTQSLAKDVYEAYLVQSKITNRVVFHEEIVMPLVEITYSSEYTQKEDFMSIHVNGQQIVSPLPPRFSDETDMHLALASALAKNINPRTDKPYVPKYCISNNALIGNLGNAKLEDLKALGISLNLFS